MKINSTFFCLFLGIIYIACEDPNSRIGINIQPDEDKISVFDTTVIVEARTIEIDSLYARSVNGFLGNFYDPSYGNIKSSYMCQYYPSVGFPYLDSIVDNKIDLVVLSLYYRTFMGDSVAPMEVTVFPVKKALRQHYYSNIKPEDYCDINNPIGKYSYTARNLELSDSDLYYQNYFYSVSIPLPVKIGQDYLDKVLNKEIKNLNDFLDFFPGTYITTTFGTGSLIPVYRTEINLFYKRRTVLTDVDGNDSIAEVKSAATFSVTKEVIQINSFENKNPSFLLEDNPEKLYIKSPVGVFTELTIPTKEIIKGIGKKKFSSVRLSLKAYPRNEWNYSLQLPGTQSSLVPISDNSGSGYSSKLLLIEPDSIVNFFEGKKVADGKTSFTAQLNSFTYSYDFNNIANAVQNAIEKAPDKDLKFWLVPVLTTWFEDQYSSVRYIDYMTSHYLFPSGLTLKKGGDNLRVRVIATDLSIND